MTKAKSSLVGVSAAAIIIATITARTEAQSACEGMQRDIPLQSFVRGDCNGDGAQSISDSLFLLYYLFLGGAEPPCLAACDINGDGKVSGSVSDALYSLSTLFLGGPQPPGPYPACGVWDDAAFDKLGCNTPPCAFNDFDADGVKDENDNCPCRSNPDQADRDGDGSGDVCDACPDSAANDCEAARRESGVGALAKQAELVFLGQVTAVAHRTSEGDPVVPHTFVTFAIEETLKGSVAGGESTMTLRLAGGPDDQGRIFWVFPSTLFDVGDRDILFVRKNGGLQCPLVGFQEGRFRVAGDHVFSESGREVLLDGNGQLALGQTMDLEEVRSNRIGEHVVERLRGVRQDEAGQTLAADGAPPGNAAQLAEFLAWLRREVSVRHTQQELAAVQPTSSLDPSQSFTVPGLEPKRFRAVDDGEDGRQPDEK